MIAGKKKEPVHSTRTRSFQSSHSLLLEHPEMAS